MTESAAYMVRPQLPPPQSTATGDDEPCEYELAAMKNPACVPVKHDTHQQEPVGVLWEQLDEDAYEIIPADFQ